RRARRRRRAPRKTAFRRISSVSPVDYLRLRRRGTLAPARRACDRPMAIACFLLFTRLPERPLLSVPRLRSCIAFLTLRCAFLPYLAMQRLCRARARQKQHDNSERPVPAEGTASRRNSTSLARRG